MIFLTKRFLPFFSTMFFGAFNDNMFRNALVIMISYQMAYAKDVASSLSFLAMALLMLPYFPFSALAGAVADKFDNAKLFRYIKLAELLLMLGTGVAFYYKSITTLMILLFLMGTQSAFFSPLKYSYIPRSLPKEYLLKGNGVVNAGTYIGVIIGAVLGSEVITFNENGRIYLSIGLIIFAIVGFLASLFIPYATPAKPEQKLNFNCFSATWQILKLIFQSKPLRVSAIGLSAFWMTAALYISQLAPFCNQTLSSVPRMVPFLYLLFSLGVAIGSLLCTLLNRSGKILNYLPIALLIMAAATFDLYFTSHSWIPSEEIIPLAHFFTLPNFYRIMFDLILLAACGGFYSVPLTALIQKMAKPNEVAQIVAGNNILNSAFIALGTLLISALIGNIPQLGVNELFAIVGLINLLTALYLLRLRNFKL